MRINLKYFNNTTFRYTLFGVLFGFIFPVFSIIIDAHFKGIECGFGTCVILHKSNPIHYIIDTAPFFLGLFAWFIGKKATRAQKAYREVQLHAAERKAAEKAMLENAEKFKMFSEQNLIGVLILQGLALKYVNQAVAELFEYSIEEIQQDGAGFVSEMIHPEDRGFVLEQARKKQAGDKDAITRYPFRIITKSKKIKWVELYSKALIYDGEPAVFAILIDITDRTRASEELRASEKRYREFFESLVEGIGLVDENEIILNCNPAFAEIFEEASRDDMIGKCLLDYIPESEHEKISKQNEMRKQGKKSLYEIELITAKNNRKNLQVLISPQFDERGNYVAALGSLIDITERKLAEESLRESEERYRDLVENMNEVIYSIDSTGVLNYISPALERFSQYSPAELLDHKLSEFILPEDRNNYLENLLRNMLGHISTTEYRFVIKSGECRWVQLSNKPIFMGDSIVGVQGAIKDITERKLAEQQRKELQKKLKDSEKMESLGLLAGGVAHDLNNTLGPLVGYSDLILRQIDIDNPFYKKIQHIQKAARDAAEVIQDLLTMARRGRYEMKPIDLNEVIKTYLESPGYLNKAMGHPEVEVSLKLGTNNTRIMGSAPHLSKVLMNLIINAFDAMPSAGKLIIETCCESIIKPPHGLSVIPAGEYLRLKINDTGSGIKPEDIDKIFEPYYSNKKMGSSGSGLGLAVVHGIVEDHKGYYEVSSEVGRGTDFSLFFPVTNNEITGEKPTEDNYEGDETILVVDDAWEQREIMTALLSSVGYNILTAINGRDALRILDGKEVDLVILDMIMEKDFDGLDTYTEIIKRRPDQKTIIISGYSITERVERMQALGAGAFVKKPFTRDDIGRAVRRALDAPVQDKLVTKIEKV